MKKVKLAGVVLTRDGSLKSQEFHGPSNISHWVYSYTVLQNVLVMLDAVDLGNLLRYRNLVERYHDRFSEKVWSVVYQGDVRCRLEHMPRLKRIVQADYDAAMAAGTAPPSGFDPNRPWNYVWGKACEDYVFWREEVNDPCFLILTKIANSNEIIEGDAKTAAASGSPRETQPVPGRVVHELPDSSGRDKAPRRSSRTGRFNNVEDGKYTTNRTGYKICRDYNTVGCGATVQGIWCPHSWDTTHQCDKCLGGHASNKCPHGEMPEPTFVKKQAKGKGKKGGGKKGKGGKRPPY